MGLTQAAWCSATLQARQCRAHGGAKRFCNRHSIALSLRSQEEALQEQIKCGTAKHLALEHFQAVDMALIL